MLTRLSVKNFRLLRDVAIDVEPGKPIVLIGPNGAGKSSVIQALGMLGRFGEEGFEKAVAAYGGSKSLVTANKAGNGERLVLEIESHFAVGETMVRHWVAVDDGRHGIELCGETVRVSSADAGAAPEQVYGRDGVDVWAQNSRLRSNDVAQGNEDELSFELFKNKTFYPELESLREQLAQVWVYDGFLTAPLWTRDVREGRLTVFDGAVVAPCPRVDRRGFDLINALYYLQSSHPEEWEVLERNFRAEFPFVQRLEFPADPAGGRIGLAWRDRRYPGVRMQGHQMSEGMATYLCLLAAILTPEPATAIAFDEPERHLHPSALRRVVYLLERLSERTAVFVATQSDRFLDHLSDPAGSLRVCEPSEEGVTIRALDREALDAWRAEYTLSELRAQGQLDLSNASGVEP